jgi:hypothetical protein
MDLFLVVALVVAATAIVAAGAAYGYQKYLSYQLEQKMQLLSESQARVDEDQIEEFVRLRDRLASGNELLTNQVTLSKFFDSIEDLTLQNVRFNSLELVIAGDGSAKLDVEGTARNFNTLAAQSNAFAGERGIRRAIFSGITLTDTRQVSFRLTADIDPRLIVAGKDVPAPAADPLTMPVQQSATTTTPSLGTTTTPRAPTTTSTAPRP